MEFKELVKARRSCRSYEASEISEDQIAAILEAGQWAPSPLNRQPWEFIIITENEIKAQIKKAAEDAKQQVVGGGGPGWASKYGMDFLDEAPVYIGVVVDPSKGGLGSFFGQSSGALEAVSACVQNMMLAATDQGLGSLWFTFFAPEKVQSILNVPENLEVAGIIPIGTPKEEATAPPRKEPKVHKERYTH